MAALTEQQKQKILDDLRDILNEPDIDASEMLYDVCDLLWSNELYGCTDPDASNFCANCIYSTDTCLYLAPPEGNE